jgi:hypothetical protein
MLVTLSGIVTLIIFLQPLNAEFPITVTPLGIVIFPIRTHSENASLPILVIPEEIVTSVRLEHP